MTLLIAMLLDAALGDPRWLWSRIPHPTAMLGRAVVRLDLALNSGGNRGTKGGLALLCLLLGAVILGFVLHLIPGRIVDILVLAVLLAQRALSDHCRAMAAALKSSLAEGRAALGKYTESDTSVMTESEVARAAIEHGAHTLSTGVIAPIFWFLLGGLPGLLVYKITESAAGLLITSPEDTKDFGTPALRLHDMLTYVPARLTCLLIAASTFRFDTLGEVFADAPKQPTANAGWPEAAMAHGLNIALRGPRIRDAQQQNDPFLNEDGIEELSPTHITEAVRVLWQAWALVLAPVAVAVWLLH